MNIKSQLAPKGIEFKPTEMVISGKYCTILTIITYPKYISEGYLANLTNINSYKMRFVVFALGVVFVNAFLKKRKTSIIMSREKLRSLKCYCMSAAVRNGKPVLFVPVSSLIK